MILSLKSLSLPHRGASIFGAGIAFAAGIVVGAQLAPVTAARVAEMPAPLAAAVPDVPQAAMRASHPAEVLRVLDGDTFEARIRVWPGMDITTKVRLRGIDAPEMKARCGEERSKAEVARTALARILAEGTVGIAQVAPDKYGGRVVASASTRMTGDVSAALLNSNLVRSYGGGRRENWCVD